MLIIMGLAVVLLTSCKTKYITVPEYHTKYIVRTDSVEKWDSIYYHDSVYVFKQGDTITQYKLKEKYIYKYLDKVRVDSFIKTDSIRVPYPVEKKLSKWEKVKMDVGGFGLIATAIAFIYFLFKLFRWLRVRSS